LADDLNTANALTCLFDMLKDDSVNNNTKLYLVKDFEQVLSLGLLDNDENKLTDESVKEIEKLIEERNEAKANKDYAKADEIRNILLQKGVQIKDSRDGTTWEIIK
jgi:cysteinyl-tRNA synthetase